MGKVIKLTENQFSEMMAYHGSCADFDKFNHKKYLSTGAGSQVFGWGTYVTSDFFVARGYTEKEVNDAPTMSHKEVKEYIRKNIFKCEDCEAYDEIWAMLSVRGSRKSSINFFQWLLDTDAMDVGLPNFDAEKETEKQHKMATEAISILNSISDSQYYDARNFDEKILMKYTGYIYEVDIPDDNGYNYLSWYDKATNEQQKAIKDGLDKFEKRFKQKMLFVNLNRIEDIKYHVEYIDLKTFYKGLSEIFEVMTLNFGSKKGDKAASLFLMQCGFDGIKYPAGTIWKKPDGTAEDAMNYVIFDANKVKIVNKTKI